MGAYSYKKVLIVREVSIIVGLGYGDEGKGSIVDYLARRTQTSLVVRYNGGAQAAHNVITPEGQHHTFAQFGSGSFLPGSATLLSKYMLVNPLNLYTEGRHLAEIGVPNVWDRMFIDERAKIITPWHVMANRAREKARGENRHGSCGQGIGETASDALNGFYVTLEDLLKSPEELKAELKSIREFKKAQLASEIGDWQPDQNPEEEEEYLNKIVSLYMTLPETVHIVGDDEIEILFEKPEQVIFEGAQGVLLDENYGWHPYTTWSNTTKYNAEQIMLDYGCTGDKVKTIGVTRAYATRHGNGPLPTENNQTGGVEAHNVRDKWQGEFRIGAFDGVTFQYALIASGGVDELAVTCLDQVLNEQYICTSYYHEATQTSVTSIDFREQPDLQRQEKVGKFLMDVDPMYNVLEGPDQLILWLSQLVPVNIISIGPTANDKELISDHVDNILEHNLV